MLRPQVPTPPEMYPKAFGCRSTPNTLQQIRYRALWKGGSTNYLTTSPIVHISSTECTLLFNIPQFAIPATRKFKHPDTCHEVRDVQHDAEFAFWVKGFWHGLARHLRQNTPS
jgi:hypothetical protein